MTTAPVSIYFGATSIGVSDLEKSTDFYTRILGMKIVYKHTFPSMDEVVLTFGDKRGAYLTLIHFIDGSNPNYKNNPIKIAFYTDDPQGYIDRIRQEGYEILRDAVPYPEFRNAVFGIAKDPDGYWVEFLPISKA